MFALDDRELCVVCVFPLRFRLRGSFPPASADAQGWSLTKWAKCFPEQFRRSFASAIVFDDDMTALTCEFDGCFSGRGSQARLILFSESIGCLVTASPLGDDCLSAERAHEAYGRIAAYQECDLRRVVEERLKVAGLPGPDVTPLWSYSINLVGLDETQFEPCRAAFEIFANVNSEGIDPIATRNRDYEMVHAIGTTGSLCFGSNTGEYKYSIGRVIALWCIFYTYYSISLDQYNALSDRESLHKKLPKVKYREYHNIIDDYVSRQREIVLYQALFDPFNICTRGFDADVYYRCWKHYEIESIISKLDKISAYYVGQARELRSELTQRYESFVGGVLFVLAFTQLIPIIRSALAMASSGRTALGAETIEISSYALTFVVCAVVYLIARRSR